MQARQSKELNDLRRAFSKQEHELKLLPGGTNAIPAKNFDFRKIIVDQSKKQIHSFKTAPTMMKRMMSGNCHLRMSMMMNDERCKS